MNNKKSCQGKRCGQNDMYYPQGGPSYPWMPQPTPPRPMPPQSMPPQIMPQPTPDDWMPWMGARGAMMPVDQPPQPMDDLYTGSWIMPQWNARMWTPQWEEDPKEQQDREYWMQMYPRQTRQIQREVEHQCDLMDYEGSVMYDEYPDRIALARVCESVYQALMQDNANGAGKDGMTDRDDMGDVNGAGSPENFGERIDMMQIRQPDHSLRSLIEVLLYHEMHQRRRKRRRRWGW